MDKQQQYIQSYRIHKMLGEGGQAQQIIKLFSVYLVSKNNETYAAKVYFEGSSKAICFKQQAQYLTKLKHNNIINLIQAIPHAKVKLNNAEETIRNVLILEYAEGGEMFQLVLKQGKFSPRTCKKIFKELIGTISFMNQNGIAHRDLKSDNLLFDNKFNLKVTDLGLATMLSENEDQDGFLRSIVGTQGFRPPEMEKGKYNGLECDIFAAGVILFSMFAGSPPFLSTKYSDKIYRMIREGNFQKFWNLHQKKKGFEFFPKQLKKLLNSFFSLNPDKRPTLQSLKTDQWLNQTTESDINFETEMKTKLQAIMEQDESKKEIAELIQMISLQKLNKTFQSAQITTMKFDEDSKH